MKSFIPLILILLCVGCSNNARMQVHYFSKAVEYAKDGDCDSANIELAKLKGRTEPNDENFANALLLESSCYLNGDVIEVSYAKGGYEYLAEKYPDTKAGHMAKSILSDWDNVIKQKTTTKSNSTDKVKQSIKN